MMKANQVLYKTEDLQAMPAAELIGIILALQSALQEKDLIIADTTMRGAALQETVQKLQEKIQGLEGELKNKEAMVMALLQQLFGGNKSEKLPHGKNKKTRPSIPVDAIIAWCKEAGISLDALPGSLKTGYDEEKGAAVSDTGNEGVGTDDAEGTGMPVPIPPIPDEGQYSQHPGEGPATGGLEDRGGATEEETGGEDEKRSRGNRNLERFARFKEKYFPEGTPELFEIDGFNHTREWVEDTFGSIEKMIYVASEVDLYFTAEAIVPMVLPKVHISIKTRQEDITCRNPHDGAVFNNSACSPSLLALILFYKFVMCLSWNRAETLLHMSGMPGIKRSTFIGWANNEAGRLEILAAYLLQYAKKQDVLLADETYVLVRLDDNSYVIMKQGYFWQFRTSHKDDGAVHQAIVFRYDASRSALVPTYYLHDYTGRLLTDGYCVYRTLSTRKKGIIHCVCWVHGRRFLIKAVKGAGDMFSLEDLDLDSLTSEEKLDLWCWAALCIISKLYQIENELKDVSSSERHLRRKEQMGPLVETFFGLMEKVRSAMGQRPGLLANTYAKDALNYFENNEKALREILESGKVPLDTSMAESGMVRTAICRNNWKTMETPGGARAAALYMTLIETARAAGADLLYYLQYVIERMPAIRREHENQVLGWEDYDRKKRGRLEEARKRLAAKPHEDPCLDLAGIGKEPDLKFLECMMPWSPEYKEYEREMLRKVEGQKRTVIEALNNAAFGSMPISAEVLKRIIGNAGNQKKPHFSEFAEAAKNYLEKQGKTGEGPYIPTGADELVRGMRLDHGGLFQAGGKGAHGMPGGTPAGACSNDRDRDTMPSGCTGNGRGITAPGCLDGAGAQDDPGGTGRGLAGDGATLCLGKIPGVPPPGLWGQDGASP